MTILRVIELCEYFFPVYIIIGNLGMLTIGLYRGYWYNVGYWAGAIILNYSVFKMRG